MPSLIRADRTVTALFEKAKQLAPCVIFMDDVDSTLRHRTDTATTSVACTKAEFLKQLSSLQGTRVIFVGFLPASLAAKCLTSLFMLNLFRCPPGLINASIFLVGFGD